MIRRFLRWLGAGGWPQVRRMYVDEWGRLWPDRRGRRPWKDFED